MEKKKINKNQNPSVLRTSPLDKGDANELSYQTKTLITVFLLVTVYPVGVVMMFVWMKWNKWVKFLVVLPALLAVIIPLFILLAVGTAVLRGGKGFVNSGEFKQLRRGVINGCSMQERLIERQESPSPVEIIPSNR